MTDATGERNRRAFVTGFGLSNLVSAVVVYLGVFEGLPARWWVVDGASAILIALFVAAAGGLLAETRWAARLARVASVVSLALGLLLVTAAALTASYLSGIYGPVGRGGALILVLSAALALPYLVVLPAAELVWLGSRPSKSEEKPDSTPERT